ncbi:MAG TPA: hypothetical protein VGZ32_28125 [Actinocrinis sp.]|uniref:right-handed parallel beta-helix repeat-containing protein n=1 Tax=Actinocrinis sp. TaxID=1920516 RepID=UPI002DDDA69E|nr:hypothetical protein [Actinocrinis sp.]HEV3174249.1 hypothetical protein [Actinocrinis sp.]
MSENDDQPTVPGATPEPQPPGHEGPMALPPQDPTLQFGVPPAGFGVPPVGGYEAPPPFGDQYGAPPAATPPADGWRGRLRSASGFQRGLLVGVAFALVIGLGVWLANSGGSSPAASSGPSANPNFTFPNPSPGQVGANPSPSETGKKKKGKSGKTAAGGGPIPAYTPGGPQPAVVAAASLPGVTSADPSVTCPAATVNVSTADQLTQALAAAQPGTVIQLADGTYSGNFSGTAVGTADQPVFLCGGSGAVLDGGSRDTSGGYVFHLDNAAYWRLVGFTVQDGQKGVVLDHTDFTVIQGLTVQHLGDEGIHLREFSDDDLVLNNTVTDTGSLNPKFGEGIYIGTAQSNWCTYTACQQDYSNNNVIRGNTISKTTAENVDIKEGTTGGALIGNSFDGSSFSPKGATGWVNAKGNDYLIKGNTGHNSSQDGFQTHQILSGWGQDNVFEGNTAVVNGPGYGFHFTPVNGNVWTCDNTVQGAGAGNGNIPCAAAP